jgi:IS30 family transposase
MAGRLDRAPSTVSREVARNGGHRRYRAGDSDRAAWLRASRPKRCKLATNQRLREAIAGRLGADWSPQQIAGWLVRAFPDEPEMRVSHETIYLSLFVQSRARCVVSSSAVCGLGGRCATHGASACPRAVVSSATSC